mgnify:CR=1 FL=1
MSKNKISGVLFRNNLAASTTLDASPINSILGKFVLKSELNNSNADGISSTIIAVNFAHSSFIANKISV